MKYFAKPSVTYVRVRSLTFHLSFWYLFTSKPTKCIVILHAPLSHVRPCTLLRVSLVLLAFSYGGTENNYEILRVLLSYRPLRVCAFAKHWSFLYFSRQFAENKFQLKSTILCDIAFLFNFLYISFG